MPFPLLRLYFDNAPADAARLGQVSEIRVDQGIGVAAEAELTMPVTTSDSGEWSLLTDDFAQPFKRVRVEVKLGDGDFVALIDGPIVAQRFELDAGPDDNRMVLVVQDDSVLLNREEKVDVFEDRPEQDIVNQLLADARLQPQVDAIPAAGAALERAIVQRGTAMELLRDLARRHGMYVYVKPGPVPGQSIGVFGRPTLTTGELPEMLLLGPERNIDRFSAELDALRPLRVQAASITITDKAQQSAQADSSSLPAMDGEAVNSFLSPLTTTRLVRAREEQADIEAATQAAVDVASFAYSASAEVDSQRYQAVLEPYQVVRVAGVGGHLSGDYLISRVTHVINDASYKQQVSLRRNARGRPAGGGGGLGGLF